MSVWSKFSLINSYLIFVSLYACKIQIDLNHACAHYQGKIPVTEITASMLSTTEHLSEVFITRSLSDFGVLI